MQITIDVDTNKKVISVKDSLGNERELQSVIVCGGDAQSKKFYLFAWGSAADVGWALAHGFKAAEEEPFYKKVFTHFTQWVMLLLGLDTKSKTYIDGKALAEKWEKEDSINSEKDKSKWN